MFNFRTIDFKDKDWINKKLSVSDFMGCEYSFANNMAWKRLNDTLIADYDDFYISCSFDNNEPYFTFPAGVRTDTDYGKDKYADLFYKLKKYTDDQGRKLVITSVTKQDLEWIETYFKDKICISADRNFFDYIYRADELINLSGKKYHGKRNHIKRFCDKEWSFEEVTQKNADECIKFAADFYNARNAYDDFSAVVEQYAINLFLENLDTLNLKCAALRQEGKLVGFSVGEKLNSNTFVVHIEKALADVQGAYPMLCSRFIRNNADDCLYVNREEDMGIEGLRKSKLSYHPEFLLEKYVVEFI